MAVILPDTASEVNSRVKADVNAELSESNPWLKGSFLKGLIDGFGNRVFDEAYFQLKNLIKQLRPDTAKDEFLDFWAFVKNMVPLAAAPAKGAVTVTGTVGNSISTGDVLGLSGVEYTVDLGGVIAANVKTVSALTASGGVAVCLTDDDHTFATGKEVTIAGVVESGYNGTHVITVNGDKSFTFVVDQGVTSPASGTITATMEMVSVNVTADLTSVEQQGLDTNQDAGTELTLQNSIVGVDDIATVQWSGLVGGRNDETTAEWQTRIVTRWRNPLTEFNANRIESVAKKIDGVTRVWVYQPGMGDVVAGEVKIYFVRDNDATIVPDAGEIADVQTDILAIKPANTEDDDVMILGITGIPIDVTISGILPNTPTMRTAIENQVRSFFRGGIEEAEQLTPDKLKAEIQQTYDSSAGQRLIDFNLDTPTLTTIPNQGEIVIEGTTVIDN